MIKIETFDEYKKLVLLGEKRNIFSHQLFRVDCDKDLVITNEGPAFSAGLDLSFSKAKTPYWITCLKYINL
jgi:hypothetical protein